MSQENVELVRGFVWPQGTDLVPWTRDDELDRAERALREPFLEPDFEFVDSAGLERLGVRRRGRGWDALRANYREVLDAFESYEEETHEVRDLGGGRVLTLGMARGRTRTGGVEVVQAGGVIFTVRDSKIARIEFFLDRDEALEAAGLSD
jgi:ketosteroid isomerase-like protein